MRELPKDLLPEYEDRARGHQGRLQALQAQAAAQQGEIETANQGRRTVEAMSTSEIVLEAHTTQKASVASVGRMKSQVAETRELAGVTAAKLKAQTEQLQSVNEDISQVRHSTGCGRVRCSRGIRKQCLPPLSCAWMAAAILGYFFALKPVLAMPAATMARIGPALASSHASLHGYRREPCYCHQFFVCLIVFVGFVLVL